uniref:Secreted protein n=1 Tax=Panagrellus redivivus TaxID=6233 RepID=A0A7E4VSV3_PANRE
MQLSACLPGYKQRRGQILFKRCRRHTVSRSLASRTTISSARLFDPSRYASTRTKHIANSSFWRHSHDLECVVYLCKRTNSARQTSKNCCLVVSR